MARISVKEWRKDEGLEGTEDFNNFLAHAVYDGVVPAMCDEGCEVEPDGRCEHDCPSILIALGMI